jgi:hypothetical protein
MFVHRSLIKLNLMNLTMIMIQRMKIGKKKKIILKNKKKIKIGCIF